MWANDRPARIAWRLAALSTAAAWAAGCGGGSSSDQAAPAAKGPTIGQTVAVARHNAGLAKCKHVSHVPFNNTGEGRHEARVIISITCDDAMIGTWNRYRTPADALAAGKTFEDRRYLVNDTIKVSTGIAVFAHIDADKWESFPDELKQACHCGQVIVPRA